MHTLEELTEKFRQEQTPLEPSYIEMVMHTAMQTELERVYHDVSTELTTIESRI